ncbi:alcohol dehydrogenase [Frigoribacterium sp. RIT-PI-h]|nr:alcohol dehydrogenase [Frigoribacterium sp. RIT-PI-h]
MLHRHRGDLGTSPSSCTTTRTTVVRPLDDGEVRVRNSFVQVTAVMADLMAENTGLPMPGYLLGAPLWGGAIGTVIETASTALPVGTVVSHMSGWREESVGLSETFWPVSESMVRHPEQVLNQGVTAYHGMVDIARVGLGDVVFVTGAAGGVGSLAGQIAKARGAAQVIGSAGTDEKAEYLVEELGFDAAVNYRRGDVLDRLRDLAPDGIDVLFDTVGGSQFEDAVQAAAPRARMALCGALAGQVTGGHAGHPHLDLMTAIVKELEIRPFSTGHTPDQLQAWHEHAAQWHGEGLLVFPHTIVPGGLDAAPGALDDLLRGAFRGAVLVQL